MTARTRFGILSRRRRGQDGPGTPIPHPHHPMTTPNLNWIANYIWGIADDVLRDVYVRGKYRDVILPMTVLRRLDAVLEPTKQAVLDMKAWLDEQGIVEQKETLRQAAGQAFYNTSKFTLHDLRARASRQQLKADFEDYLDGFSPGVQDILENFEFRNQIPRLSKADALGSLIEKLTSPEVNLSPDPEGVPGIVGGIPDGRKRIVVASRGPDSRLESGSETPTGDHHRSKRRYEKKGHPDKADLRELLARDGRDYLLPLRQRLRAGGMAKLDHIIDVIGRATRSRRCWTYQRYADVAGEKQPAEGAEGRGRERTTGGSGAGCTWRTGPSGSRGPGCRSAGEGELAIPAYEALRRPAGLGSECLNCCWPA